MGVFVDDVVRPLALPHDNLYRSIEYEKEAEKECQSTCDGRHRIERNGRGGRIERTGGKVVESTKIEKSDELPPTPSTNFSIQAHVLCDRSVICFVVTHFSKTVLPLVLFPDLKKKKR